MHILLRPLKILPLLITPPALAQSADPQSVLNLRGVCEALSIGAEDLVDICSTEIMQVIYTDDTMEIAIWTDDPSGRFLVLSGPVEQTETGSVQTIKRIIDGKDGSGNNNVEHAAKGQCTITGTPARFDCTASDKTGTTYAFSFQTDGSEPESMLD